MINIFKKTDKFSFINNLFVFFYIFILIVLNTPSIVFFFRDPDQGVQLAKAIQILRGYHPFVNITGNIYGPLVFYISALGQLLSGHRLIGEIIIIVIGYLISYFLLFKLISKITENIYISFLLLTIALTMLPRFYKYYIVLSPVLFVYALCYYLFVNNNEKGLFFLSIIIGIISLYRFDFGVYSLITAVLALILRNESKQFHKLVNPMKKMIFYISLLVFPWVMFLIIKGVFPKTIIDTLKTTLNISSDLSLPIPLFNFTESVFSKYNNFSLMFWLFRLIPFIALFFLFLERKKLKKIDKDFVLITSIYSILIFIQALHRTSYSHLKQVIPIIFFLIAWLIKILFKKQINKIIRLTILFLALIMIFGWIVFLKNEKIIKRYKTNAQNLSENYKAFFYSLSELRNKYNYNVYIKTAEFINKNTLPDESVMFIPLIPQLYYFSERIFKVPLGILGPGRLYNKKKQEEFFKELINTNTNIIVDDYSFMYDHMPRRNPRYYYPYLMQLIYSKYRIIKKIGKIIILCRDNRFNSFLYTDKTKGFREFKMNDIKLIKNIFVSVKSINTFPTSGYIKKVKRKSFLFIEARIKDGAINKWKNIYFGLKNKNKVYYTKLFLSKKRRGGRIKLEIFSSMYAMPKGKYRFVLIMTGGEKENRLLLLKNKIEII